MNRSNMKLVWGQRRRANVFKAEKEWKAKGISEGLPHLRLVERPIFEGRDLSDTGKERGK